MVTRRPHSTLIAVPLLCLGACSRADSHYADTFERAWQTVNDSYFDPTFGGLDW